MGVLEELMKEGVVSGHNQVGSVYGVAGRLCIGLGAHSRTSANEPCTRSTSCTSNILNVQTGQQLDLVVEIRDGDRYFATGVTDV